MCAKRRHHLTGALLLTKLLIVIVLHAFACFVSLQDQPLAFCSEELRVVQHDLNVHQVGSSTLLGTVVQDRHGSPLTVGVSRREEG